MSVMSTGLRLDVSSLETIQTKTTFLSTISGALTEEVVMRTADIGKI